MSQAHVSALKELGGRVSKSLSKHQNTRAASFLADHAKLVRALEGITGMKDNPNSLETPAAHSYKLTQSAKKLSTEAGRIKEKVYENYQNYSMELSAAIFERGGVVENKYASEVRAAFRALPTDKRMEFLKEITDKTDGASFAAITNAPEILTGITPEMNRNLSDAYYAKAAPDLFQEQQDLAEAMDGMVASLRIVESDAQSYQDPETMRKIEVEVQRSQEASSKFNAAFTE